MSQDFKLLEEKSHSPSEYMSQSEICAVKIPQLAAISAQSELVSVCNGNIHPDSQTMNDVVEGPPTVFSIPRHLKVGDDVIPWMELFASQCIYDVGCGIEQMQAVIRIDRQYKMYLLLCLPVVVGQGIFIPSPNSLQEKRLLYILFDFNHDAESIVRLIDEVSRTQKSGQTKLSQCMHSLRQYLSRVSQCGLTSEHTHMDHFLSEMVGPFEEDEVLGLDRHTMNDHLQLLHVEEERRSESGGGDCSGGDLFKKLFDNERSRPLFATADMPLKHIRLPTKKDPPRSSNLLMIADVEDNTMGGCPPESKTPRATPVSLHTPCVSLPALRDLPESDVDIDPSKRVAQLVDPFVNAPSAKSDRPCEQYPEDAGGVMGSDDEEETEEAPEGLLMPPLVTYEETKDVTDPPSMSRHKLKVLGDVVKVRNAELAAIEAMCALRALSRADVVRFKTVTPHGRRILATAIDDTAVILDGAEDGMVRFQKADRLKRERMVSVLNQAVNGDFRMTQQQQRDVRRFLRRYEEVLDDSERLKEKLSGPDKLAWTLLMFGKGMLAISEAQNQSTVDCVGEECDKRNYRGDFEVV